MADNDEAVEKRTTPQQPMPTPSSIGPAGGDPNAGFYGEMGVSGLHAYSGFVNEEYLPELRGLLATRVYRQMSEGDPIVVAVLTAISLILRAVDWRVEPADDSTQAETEASFVESLLDDMSHPFEDFIGEALSMLAFGWAYHEIVLKQRQGPDQKDPAKRSRFTDGRIGVRKLAIRAQDTRLRWEMQADGGIDGMWQQPPMGGPLILIPIDRSLLFRTTSRKNNPEGVSILRAAYRSWYLKKTIEDYEAIGIERELAGLPVVHIPAKYLDPNASAADKAVAAKFEKVARDVKFNQQAGLIIPSDPWRDGDGNPTQYPQVKVELLSTAGRRSIDPGPAVERHNRDIARSALADFIMLGETKGSYALSKNKSELFLRACETFLNQIAAPLNRFLLPRIWNYNGLDKKLMPTLVPGRVAPVDLAELGAYIQQLATAGAPLFPDPDLEEYTREIADLPAPSPDAQRLPAGSNADAADVRGDHGEPIDPPDATASDATEGFFSATSGPRTKRAGNGLRR